MLVAHLINLLGQFSGRCHRRHRHRNMWHHREEGHVRQRDGRHRRWWRRRKRKRRGEAWTGRGEEIAEFGEVYGEVDVALGAAEASEAMGHIEDGLAARARQLDLRGVHALRSRRGAAGRGRERSRRRRRLKLRMRLWLRRRSRGGLGRGRGMSSGGRRCAMRHLGQMNSVMPGATARTPRHPAQRTCTGPPRRLPARGSLPPPPPPAIGETRRGFAPGGKMGNLGF